VPRRNKNLAFKLVGATLALLLLLMWFAQPAVGVSPPLQGTPRPTLPPGGPPPPSGAGSGTDGGVVTDENCASLRGTVINWGFQNEPDVALRLGDGGWEVFQVTADDGRYSFGPLGQGIAFLSVNLSPEQAETLRPMADEVAIRLRCDFEMVVNVGLYSGSTRPDPPATLTMSVSQVNPLPGGSVVFYMAIANDMPHAISHVFVTDYLPDGLTVTEAVTTHGFVEVLNGRMVTASIDSLAQGEQATVQITAQVSPDLAYGTRLQNVASLLYAESAADQAWVNLVVGGTGQVEAAPTVVELAATSTPTAAPEATATVAAEETPTPESLATEASPTPESPDELLPITGTGTGVVLPVAGFVLALLVLGVHRLRQPQIGD
jgi:uncharacterized repeat protein (TIGR01451 family)